MKKNKVVAEWCLYVNIKSDIRRVQAVLIWNFTRYLNFIDIWYAKETLVESWHYKMHIPLSVSCHNMILKYESECVE